MEATAESLLCFKSGASRPSRLVTKVLGVLSVLTDWNYQTKLENYELSSQRICRRERGCHFGRSNYSSDGYEERLHASRASSCFRTTMTRMIHTPNRRLSEREPAVSLGVKYERHRRLAPVADLCASRQSSGCAIKNQPEL